MTHRHTTLDRSSLDERSARHGDLYLTHKHAHTHTHTQHSQQTDIHAQAGFEPEIPADPPLRPRVNWDRLIDFMPDVT